MLVTGREDPEVAFEEPWHVEAFAVVVALTRQRMFTWTEWVEEFSTEILHHPRRDDETVTESYYRQWLATVTRMVDRHASVSSATVDERHEQWRRAYLGTPHGQPIELSNHVRVREDCPTPAHDHDHPVTPLADIRERIKPIAVHAGNTAGN
ncbi:nitrile hydratase accessory protein [Mycobacterium sp. 21AC1]|uniref:nitrile hydratase accessory protein n=1 Tax=[Mycobacterium] appelbergii TaxID=2939269 RepID=UPI0029392AE4|nr:nitrile hydratase accessory protein [Mycobacterium sp. 21AC1]MDV3125323.1 nitrile hydratase accessory protein [Mycobacterium sp. 21AC1]